jgi:cobalt-zinc-cadmium efflux system outer membrane protein
MNRRAVGFVAMLAAGGAGGCAPIRPGAAFSDVQRIVGARTPRTVHWNQGTPADREVEERIAALLRSELTPEAAVQIALFNNRSLQAVFARLGIAQADVVQAGLLPNPVAHFAWRFATNGAGPSAEANLLVDFIQALHIPLRKRVAEAALEAAKLEVAQAVIDLAADVKAAYFRLQGAEQMLELRQTVTRATDYAAGIAARQREAGAIRRLDLANERALHEQAKLDLARAEAEVLAEREHLNMLLGLWGPQTRWTLPRRLPELPRESLPAAGLESLAVSQRLDLAAARQDAEQAAHALGLRRVEALVPTGITGAEAEREPEGEWTVGPAIELPIPVFDRGQARLAGAAAELREHLERYRALAVDVRSQVRRAWTRMESARLRAAHYPAVLLPLRREILQETQHEYNAMLVGVYQLLQAKRDEIEAGRGYVETLTEYWVARAELERAVGGDLPLSGGTPPPAGVEPAPPEAGGGPHHHHGR